MSVDTSTFIFSAWYLGHFILGTNPKGMIKWKEQSKVWKAQESRLRERLQIAADDKTFPVL